MPKLRLNMLKLILKDKIFSVKRFFLFKYQKLTRGFSDDELWNLDHTIVQFILPRLKQFKKVNNGYPPYGTDLKNTSKKIKMTQANWDAILDAMIEAFTILVDEDYCFLNEAQEKIVDKGLKYFGLYFRNLWY